MIKLHFCLSLVGPHIGLGIAGISEDFIFGHLDVVRRQLHGTAPDPRRQTGSANHPRLEMDDQGNALAVWAYDEGGHSDVWSARHVASAGGWSLPKLVEHDEVEAAVDSKAIPSFGNPVRDEEKHKIQDGRRDTDADCPS